MTIFVYREWCKCAFATESHASMYLIERMRVTWEAQSSFLLQKEDKKSTSAGLADMHETTNVEP